MDLGRGGGEAGIEERALVVSGVNITVSSVVVLFCFTPPSALWNSLCVGRAGNDAMGVGCGSSFVSARRG